MLSWAIEAALVPRSAVPWKRPWRALVAHTGIFGVGFAIELLIFRRPIFGVLNLLLLQLLLVLVSNAKHRALREPFVYQDIEYFLDALKHPRLYLPFINLWLIALLAAAYAAACVVAVRYEPAIFVSAADMLLLPGAVLVAALGMLASCKSAILRGLSFDAASDLRRIGQLAYLWGYAVAEKEIPTRSDNTGWGQIPEGRRPDLVSIQSESFFDPRRYVPHLNADILQQFDRLCAESVMHGHAQVPAWGANTVRSEFAFLSGLGEHQLGVHRFNPYRRLAPAGTSSLARHLKSQGYRTICLHPFHATFYRRADIIPILGFDEFISLEDFDPTDASHPYYGDIPLGQRVLRELDARTDQPLYVHVITMENHGPLHWERVTDQDRQAIAAGPLPPQYDELVAYVRHLKNADAMFGQMAEAFRGRARQTSLCIFGDHIPIMRHVYDTYMPDGKTPFVIWSNYGQGKAVKQDLVLSDLARTWLASL
ncbi:LTA synthase family protein [Bordetella genomosp. 7]|uniref:LTA synthase family protein n=1 Tax=Bordetella genomosp. 7 TaxID=1416805 RepID=UPI000B9E892A|nr:LTA synthase family protein [Bordetella genomosp. 7]